MHIHAAVERCGLDGHRREAGSLRHQFRVAGGGEAEVALGHHLQAVPIVRVAQVIGQEGVHHHALEGQAMAQQHQAVVFGVLERLGVGAAGEPGGQGLQHCFQGKLGEEASLRRFAQAREQSLGLAAAMADRDVGQINEPLTPAEAQPHQFGLERVEGGGLGVEGHGERWIGGRQQPLHQGVQLLRRGDDLGLEGRKGNRRGGGAVRGFLVGRRWG